MASFYIEEQSFGWDEEELQTYNSEEIRAAPRPRIALIISAKQWYEFNRDDIDAVVYWASEALAFERSEGKPIVPLSDKDFVFSSSVGPNNQHNLQFWFFYLSAIYNQRRFQKFIPSVNITENKLFCSLGYGRLPRCYIWCKLANEGLINDHLVSFVSQRHLYNVSKDYTNELIGQKEMSRYVIENSGLLPIESVRFKDDWRLMKKHDDLYGKVAHSIQTSAIFPTKVLNRASLMLVPETIMHEHEFFVTEKTIKALISGRPALIIANKGNLDMLKDLGFRTWSTILNEEYQHLIGHKARIDSAIEETKRYLQWNVLRQPKAQREIQEIALHNRQVLSTTDWYKPMHQAIKIVKDKLCIPSSTG